MKKLERNSKNNLRHGGLWRYKISRISRKSADSKNMNRSDLSAIHKQILTNMDIGVEYSTEQIAEKIY